MLGIVKSEPFLWWEYRDFCDVCVAEQFTILLLLNSSKKLILGIFSSGILIYHNVGVKSPYPG